MVDRRIIWGIGRIAFYVFACCAAGAALGFLCARTFAVAPVAAALVGLVAAVALGLLVGFAWAVHGRW